MRSLRHSAILLACLLFSSSAMAQYENAAKFSIQQLYECIPGDTRTINISVTKGSVTLSALDFTLGYDKSTLTLLDVQPGTALTQYEWEYFRYLDVSDSSCSDCTSGMVRIVAIPDELAGIPHMPSSYTLVKGDEFATLTFKITNDRSHDCQMFPVRWIWGDCLDNAIQAFTMDTLYVSRKVRDYVWSNFNSYVKYREDLTGKDSAYPTFGGVTPECYEDFASYPLESRIDFENGGVHIQCNSIDARGDINLNGLANELDDAKMFASYFADGFGTLSNREASLAASEINGDGIPLTVSDLVYQITLINGDALPTPHVLHYPVESVDLKIENGIVSASKPLGGVYFEIQGIADVRLLAPNMEMQEGNVDGNTHVIVYPPFQRSTTESVDANALIWTNGKILKAEASDPYGAPVGVELQLPERFSLYQNFPNPFNPTTTIGFDLVDTPEARLQIYNVSGQLVKQFDGPFAVGHNEVTWDASDFASGVYFYKVTAGVQSKTLKMVLLK